MQAWQWTVLCGLPHSNVRLPPGTPRNLETDEAWALATNDQFGLSRLLTTTHVHTALRNLSRATLSSRFNWRGVDATISGSVDVVGRVIAVRHDDRQKSIAVSKWMRRAMRWATHSRLDFRAKRAATVACRGEARSAPS